MINWDDITSRTLIPGEGVHHYSSTTNSPAAHDLSNNPHFLSRIRVVAVELMAMPNPILCRDRIQLARVFFIDCESMVTGTEKLAILEHISKMYVIDYEIIQCTSEQLNILSFQFNPWRCALMAMIEMLIGLYFKMATNYQNNMVKTLYRLSHM